MKLLKSSKTLTKPKNENIFPKIQSLNEKSMRVGLEEARNGLTCLQTSYLSKAQIGEPIKLKQPISDLLAETYWNTFHFVGNKIISAEVAYQMDSNKLVIDRESLKITEEILKNMPKIFYLRVKFLEAITKSIEQLLHLLYSLSKYTFNKYLQIPNRKLRELYLRFDILIEKMISPIHLFSITLMHSKYYFFRCEGGISIFNKCRYVIEQPPVGHTHLEPITYSALLNSSLSDLMWNKIPVVKPSLAEIGIINETHYILAIPLLSDIINASSKNFSVPEKVKKRLVEAHVEFYRKSEVFGVRIDNEKDSLVFHPLLGVP